MAKCICHFGLIEARSYSDGITATMRSGENGMIIRQQFNQNLRALILLLWLGLAAFSSIPATNSAQDLYPNALLVEPIKLRAGFVHVTQAFEVADPAAVREVSIGFKRVDDKLPIDRFFCFIDSRLDKFSREYHKCPNNEPGINLRWELVNEKGESLVTRTYDALVNATGSQSTKASLMLGLYTFSKQPKGMYRLKVTVLRDFPELDITDPHIVVGKPFFRFIGH